MLKKVDSASRAAGAAGKAAAHKPPQKKALAAGAERRRLRATDDSASDEERTPKKQAKSVIANAKKTLSGKERPSKEKQSATQEDVESSDQDSTDGRADENIGEKDQSRVSEDSSVDDELQKIKEVSLFVHMIVFLQIYLISQPQVAKDADAPAMEPKDSVKKILKFEFADPSKFPKIKHHEHYNRHPDRLVNKVLDSVSVKQWSKMTVPWCFILLGMRAAIHNNKETMLNIARYVMSFVTAADARYLFSAINESWYDTEGKVMTKFVQNNVKVKAHLKTWMKGALSKLFNTKMDLLASERMRRTLEVLGCENDKTLMQSATWPAGFQDRPGDLFPLNDKTSAKLSWPADREIIETIGECTMLDFEMHLLCPLYC